MSHSSDAISSPAAPAMAICNAKGEVAWASDAMAALFGRATDDLVGAPAASLAARAGVDEDQVASARARLRAGEAARLVVRLASPPRPGREIELLVQPVPPLGADGPSFVAFATDVTERRRAESALRESEERYRLLVEACPEPIVVHAGGRIRFINPAGVQMLGAASEEELIGRSIMDFVHRDFHAIVAERVRKMEETGEGGYLLEEKIVRPDGSVLDVEIAGAPVMHEGERAIQLVGRDVTPRRRAEQAQRRLQDRIREARRRESLAAVAEGVAQQLGELSGEIVGTADEALAQAPEGPRAGALVAVRRAGLRMAALTDQLLAFAGKRRGRPRPLDLSSLVVEISDLLDREAGDFAITYELPADLPRVALDAPQMRRVALGLVRNAADALGAGPGRIVVRTGVVEADEARLARVQPPDALAPGRYVALEVRDTGCGMDAETRVRSLDPFFSTKARGRGLGLCEVLGLVRAQGGAVEVESEPGLGTSMTVLLPALPASSPPRRGRRLSAV